MSFLATIIGSFSVKQPIMVVALLVDYVTIIVRGGFIFKWLRRCKDIAC